MKKSLGEILALALSIAAFVVAVAVGILALAQVDLGVNPAQAVLVVLVISGLASWVWIWQRGKRMQLVALSGFDASQIVARPPRTVIPVEPSPGFAATVTVVVSVIAGVAAVASAVALTVILAGPEDAEVDDALAHTTTAVFFVGTLVSSLGGALVFPRLIDVKRVRAISLARPDAEVWPALATSGLRAYVAATGHPQRLRGQVYLTVEEYGLTVWHREGAELVAVLTVPREAIVAVEAKDVSYYFDEQPGVHLTFQPAHSEVTVQLFPRITSRSDLHGPAARLTAALS